MMGICNGNTGMKTHKSHEQPKNKINLKGNLLNETRYVMWQYFRFSRGNHNNVENIKTKFNGLEQDKGV